MSAIRVVVAEDQAMVRGALCALLRMEADIDIVAEAGDGDAALAAIAQHDPDIALLDIEMPARSGLDVAAEVQRLGLRTRVVIVTTFARAGFLRRALDAGVGGYVLKDRPARELAAAIRRVHAGLRAIDPELAIESWSEADPLSEREREALRFAADGKAVVAIAASLGLSEGTVRNYLSSAIGKTGGTNRIDAARIARERGWL